MRAHSISGIAPVVGVHANVFEMGIAVWQSNVQCASVAERVYEAIWAEVLNGRMGLLADYSAVKDVLIIYLHLGKRGEETVYHTDFAAPFVHHTYHFYAQEAVGLMARVECSAYVPEAHSRISSELAAASRYVSHDTLQHICSACERAFIEQQKCPLQDFFDELLHIEDRWGTLRQTQKYPSHYISPCYLHGF